MASDLRAVTPARGRKLLRCGNDDAPREADFVLLRRTAVAKPPFRGLWRHLSTWNIFEFKGPTVSPRRGDVDLLVELGLGIDRRLQAERIKQKQRPIEPKEVSFWYLANRLGKRFLQTAEEKLGKLESLDSGLWRCRLLERMVFLVSSIELPVEADSLPLHVVGLEPLATERQVAELVLDQPHLQMLYGGWLATLHATAWKEIEAMARSTGKRLNFDIRPAVQSLGLDKVIAQVGEKEVIKQIGIDRFLAGLSPDDRRITLNRLLEDLSPAERRKITREQQ